MRMRVERLHKMLEGEYVYHLRQRVYMNIIRLYEQRIRELLGFYVLVIWAMK